MSESPHDASTSEAFEQEPQFGVADLVEAFTAMRHEYRGQTKESRQLAEQIQAAVETLKQIADPRASEGEKPRSGAEELKKFALLLAETDHQFSRALAAIEQAEAQRRKQEQQQLRAIEQYYASLNGLTRWFSRPLFAFLTEQLSAQAPGEENPALEGLHLVIARLRRSMKELQLERVETIGQPFDAQTMNAIGTMESSEHPAGHVAEQLFPCYLWQGQVLRFADVRVAS